MASVPGVVFAKAMTFIGSRASDGFGPGVPAVRDQILLTAWRRESDFESFLGDQLARPLSAGAAASWWALFEIASTRGAHFGATPLTSTSPLTGAVAVLTLGRVTPRALPTFLREGARLGRFIHGAPGLIAAWSAGFPITGNCTVSVWESEEHMLRFAYRDLEGHGRTVRRSPPILAEQLSARMRLRRSNGSAGGRQAADRAGNAGAQTSPPQVRSDV